jgi:dienelactone hydrolase
MKAWAQKWSSSWPAALFLACLLAGLDPAWAEESDSDLPSIIAPFFRPHSEFTNQFGAYRSPLLFTDGSRAGSASDWTRRREEIRKQWTDLMGPWPPVIEQPRLEFLTKSRRENFTQHRVRLEIAPQQTGEGWLLVPDGAGPFPAVLVVFYEPETSVGLNTNQFRDFGYQLAKRGFVTLNIGTPGGNAWKPETGEAQCQPLSFHAYVAANCWQVLANLPEVDRARIGVVGHSYGGKWAMFAGALWEKFACVAVSDPGIVFDETRSNVNYWEPWYLGFDAAEKRPKAGIPSAENPRTGAYKRMVEQGRDLHELHALIAPRPLLVSGGAEDPPSRWAALNHLVEVNRLLGFTNRVAMTSRKEHSPDLDSNEKLYAFFSHFLGAVPPGVGGASSPEPQAASGRLRLIIETDAGGDPDDEQSLVRFLLYANEWDVEGIIANRAEARRGENLNTERTGLGIVRRLIDAYGKCFSHLVQHDPRYPSPDVLRQRTVSGYNDTDAAVNLIITAVDRDDPRPIWYSDWGTDSGGATNNLRRTLDRVLRERGPKGYAKFKSKLRLTSYDVFGPHTTNIAPPFHILVNTFQPPLDGKRWYHRFSALTATAGGFDLVRDVLTGHGPLGALYPTNTTHWAKEGDSMTFLYLVPTGMNDPEQPRWGSWAGRYGLNTNYAGRRCFWANQFDAWNGATNRDNALRRWAAHLQNDFKARLDWCVNDFAQANHPPVARVKDGPRRTAKAGEIVTLDASDSTDPDGQPLRFEWVCYPEAGTYRGEPVIIAEATSAKASFTAPRVDAEETVHVILTVTDEGSPPLTRYQRVIVTVKP